MNEKVDIQTLPQEIPNINQGEVQLHEYLISKSLTKNKVQLNKNVFSFLLDGTKELITHNKTTLIESDKFLLIKSGNCLMSEKISLSNNYRSMLLFFPDQAIEDFLTKYKFDKKPNPNNTPFLIFKYDRITTNIVENLVHLKNQPKAFLDIILPLKLEEILMHLVQKNGVDFLYNFLHQTNDSNKTFIETIQKNALINLSIQELSFLCNMSVSTFKRKFEKEFQTSPKKWFQEKRLEHSDYLLKTKKMRPADIYEDVGFENFSSFVQAYKHKFGITPKQSQLNS